MIDETCDCIVHGTAITEAPGDAGCTIAELIDGNIARTMAALRVAETRRVHGPGVVHLCGPEAYSDLELARAVRQIAGGSLCLPEHGGPGARVPLGSHNRNRWPNPRWTPLRDGLPLEHHPTIRNQPIG